jgi:hypothetical protein
MGDKPLACRNAQCSEPAARTVCETYRALMTNGRDTLSKPETVTIAAIEQGIPLLVEAREIIAGFHTMIRKKAHGELEPSLERACASVVVSFANGVIKDKAPVSAAITDVLVQRTDRRPDRQTPNWVKPQCRGMEGVKLPAALALLLRADLRGLAKREGECLLQYRLALAPAADLADDPAEPAAQNAQLPLMPLELLGMSVAARHHRGGLGHTRIGIGRKVDGFGCTVASTVTCLRSWPRNAPASCATAGSPPAAAPTCRRAACANGSGPSAHAGRRLAYSATLSLYVSNQHQELYAFVVRRH